MSPDAFAIVDTTLREGEQFAHAQFTTTQKCEIARMLDRFGVEYVEVTSPKASDRSYSDCRAIANLGLKAKIVAHTRCHLDDVRRALEAGVDGVSVVIGTSPYLRAYSHGLDLEAIAERALEVIAFVKATGREIRFSTEDSLRTSPDQLYRLYETVAAAGVDRVGVADTVGVGTPDQIFKLVRGLRERVSCDIEFHGHNDTGCAVANAHAALTAGATHINTTVLGIGERNGITPLSGLIARLYADNSHSVKKYDLPLLAPLDRTVAAMLQAPIPFSACITSEFAFSHKAGIHTKAVLNNPRTYEVIDPSDFGLDRRIHVAHRLTGWNAVRHRANALGLNLSEARLRAVTDQVKACADLETLSEDRVDQLLRAEVLTTGAREEMHHVANLK